jgi:hypothetical protein
MKVVKVFSCMEEGTKRAMKSCNAWDVKIVHNAYEMV